MYVRRTLQLSSERMQKTAAARNVNTRTHTNTPATLAGVSEEVIDTEYTSAIASYYCVILRGICTNRCSDDRPKKEGLATTLR